MNIGLNWRHELHDVSPALVKEFESVISGLAGWSNEEHKPDGKHGDMTADSVEVSGDHSVDGHADMNGGIAFAGHISPPLLVDHVNNYGPVGIRDAFLVRVSGSGSRNITGIQDGPRVLPKDGRMIYLQNVGDTDAIILKHDDSNSREFNRFDLTDDLDITLYTSHGVLLYFNPKTRRWNNIGGTHFPSLPGSDPGVPGRWYIAGNNVKVS